MSKLTNFYNSDKWHNFREIVITERLVNGIPICEYCGKPIIGEKQLHIHHIEELTEDNVDDYAISLNPENVQILHHKCHNELHNRFNGNPRHQVYLIYGAPCSGKYEYVEKIAKRQDIIVSVDRIYEMLSVNQPYQNPKALTGMVFQVRNLLLDQIRTRSGKWHNAYIIEGLPSKAKREEYIRLYGAKPIYIESSKEDCLTKRKEENRPESIDTYIDSWFKEYSE